MLHRLLWIVCALLLLAPLASADRGGPDGYGYIWVDSDEPDGPAFNWVNLPETAQVVGGGDDVTYGPVAIGFRFPFYGGGYENVRICTNGFLAFTSGSPSFANQHIPDVSPPNGLIAPLWEDLYWSDAASIRCWTDTSNHRFIVTWEDLTWEMLRFQALLYEDGTIVYQYATVPTRGLTPTVGIESGTGALGLEVSYATEGYPRTGLAIRFDIARVNDVTAVPEDNGLRLRWSDLGGPFEFYSIYRSESYPVLPLVPNLVSTTPDTTWLDPHLFPAAHYIVIGQR